MTRPSLDAPAPEFRASLRQWLADTLPSDLPSVYAEGGLARHLAWERSLAEAGLGALHWPARHGGAGASDRHLAVFGEEFIRARCPERLNRMALGLLGPTLMDFGTPEQQQTLLPRIVTCEDLWCQGFSEPEAGSDLARVGTRATVDGDTLVVTGEKVWTSLAVYCTGMFALVRTSGRPGDHRGLTFVLIPLDLPGVSVQAIRQLHGEPGFAQVLLDAVRVPIGNVVGEIDEGWTVAMACLGYERGSALGTHVRFADDVQDLIASTRARDAHDEALRDAVVARFVETETFRHYMQAQRTIERRRELSSVTKLTWSEMQVRIFETTLEVLGTDAEILERDGGAGRRVEEVQHRYWHARGAQIFAGANEIQRNVIAERLLGLPKSPRVPRPEDRTVR